MLCYSWLRGVPVGGTSPGRLARVAKGVVVERVISRLLLVEESICEN
jgi:hypothetical protein